MFEIKPRKRAGDTASVIYDELRGKILSGEIASGAAISSASVARLHGISKAPVREALRRLQQDQLVVARANQRFHVAPFDVADLEAALNLHLVNIALAIRVGVPFLGDADIDALRTHVSAMNRATKGDPGVWAAAHREFVFVMIRPAGGRVVSFVGSLIDEVGRYQANMSLGDYPPVSLPGAASLSTIVDAAKDLDGAAASVAYV